VFVALVKLVLDAAGEVVESALRLGLINANVLVPGAETNTKVLGDALRYVDRKVRFLRSRPVIGCVGLLIEDRG
jgi:hypothetical protein